MDAVGLGALDVLLQPLGGGSADGVKEEDCQNLRHGFELPLGVKPARVGRSASNGLTIRRPSGWEGRFTTQVAAAAVSELLERLIHYGPEPVPTEVLLRAHEREVSTNDQDPRDGHYCHPGRSKLGLGDTAPFLEQTWQG